MKSGPITFSERLRRLRRLNGMTLKEAANRGGFSDKQLHHLEAGHTQNPQLNTILRLCKIYNTTPNHLLAFDEFSADDELATKLRFATEKLDRIKRIVK